MKLAFCSRLDSRVCVGFAYREKIQPGRALSFLLPADRSPKEKKGAEARKPRTGAKVSPAVEPVYHAGARMKAAVRADDLETVEPIVGPDAVANWHVKPKLERNYLHALPSLSNDKLEIS